MIKEGESLLIQTYDELLVLLAAHQVSDSEKIFYNIDAKVNKKIEKFTILNDIRSRFTRY